MKGNSMTQQEIDAEINAYEQLLRQTDYKALKYAEGQLTDKEFAEAKAERQSWRDKINELQALEPEEE